METKNIKRITYLDPRDLVGDYITVCKYNENPFFMKVKAAGLDYIAGVDNEQMNIEIKTNEIDYVIGGDNLTELVKLKDSFPIYTKKALADRWGVDQQVIQNWSVRHDDFCKSVDGIVIGHAQYYPLKEVLRYEKERGLNLK